MTQPEEDYQIPMLYGRFGKICAVLYAHIFEPMNQLLDIIAQKWHKFFFIDESKFQDTPTVLTIQQAGKEMYLSLKEKIDLSWSIEDRAIVVYVPSFKHGIFVPTSWNGYAIKLIISEAKQ